MMTLPIWIFTGICIVVAVLLYISFVQYRRAEKALNVSSVLASNMSTIYNYIQEASERMGNPQLKQAFEADDEVGFFFKELQDIQGVLDSFIPHDEETSTDIQ